MSSKSLVKKVSQTELEHKQVSDKLATTNSSIKTQIEDPFLFEGVPDILFDQLKYILSLDDNIILEHLNFFNILHLRRNSDGQIITNPIYISSTNKLTIYHTYKLDLITDFNKSAYSSLNFIKINKEYNCIKKTLTNIKNKTSLDISIFNHEQIISNINIQIDAHIKSTINYGEKLNTNITLEERLNILEKINKHHNIIKTIIECKNCALLNIKKDNDIIDMYDLEIKKLNDKKSALKAFFKVEPDTSTTIDSEPPAKKIKTESVQDE